VAGEVRLLRQVADGRAGLDESLAAIRLDQPCRNFEQRRFPGPIPADEAYALARRDRQFHAVEQRRAPESKRDFTQLDKRRRHLVPIARG
jgi:hypothetical protein